MKKKYIKREYTIFAIIADALDGGDTLVFVGKTIQKDINAVMRYYRRRNGCSAPVFEEGVAPKIICLEKVYASATEAYRYVLAFMRCFFEEGYDVVAHYLPYEACLNLSWDTQKIYNHITQKPLVEILANSPEVPGSRIISQECLTEKIPLDARLSVRLTQSEHQTFCRFCQSSGITQRDGLLLLLDKNAGSQNTLVHRMRELHQTIEMQKQQISMLESRLESGSRGANADKRLIEALAVCNRGVCEYAKSIAASRTSFSPISYVSWNCFLRICPNWKEYDFPEDGFYLFQLEYLCYGRGERPCIFLFGRNTISNQKMRFRFYDKREYIGPHPSRSIQFFKGICLLAGCKRRADNASDLIFALPLPEDTSNAPICSDTPKSILEILQDAEKRSCTNDI